MELRQLRYFIAVAEELGFHKAARRLHVAQPALTMCVKQLEEEVGHRLLDRDRHHIALTPAGQALLEEARRLVDGERAAKQSVRAAAAGEGGVLRIGVISPAMVEPVAQLLRAFHDSHPGVDLRLSRDHLEGLTAALVKGELHGVIGRPEAQSPGLQAVSIAVEEQGLLVPDSHPLALRGRLSWKQLHGQRMLLLRDNPHYGRLIRDTCEERQILPDYHHVATDLNELLWQVAAGMGSCPCSLLLGHQLPPGTVLLKFSQQAPKLRICLLTKKAHGNAAVARLVELAGAQQARAGA